MLNKLGGGGNRGNQLIQMGGSFNSLCGTAVIIISGLLIPNTIAEAKISDVFPLMYTALAIFAFAFIVILLTTIPENEKISQDNTLQKSSSGPMSYRHFVLGAIAIFIYVGVEVGIPNVMNKWLQNPVLDILGNVDDEDIAASMAGTYWFLMLIGRLIGAAVGKNVSAKSMLSFASIVSIILVILAILLPTNILMHMPVFNGANGFGLVNVPLCASLLVFVGLCTSVMWGGIFNLAVEGLGNSTEKASGIFMALVCGGGILPLIQNAIVDTTGTAYQASYWIIVAGLAYILFYALIGSKQVKKNITI